MNLIRNVKWFVAVAFVMLCLSPWARAGTLPVTGWAVHNQSAPPAVITDAATNSPTIAPADNSLTVMGTFPGLELLHDGDFIKVSTTLMMATRPTNTGVNALNTQLRFGIYDGPDGPVTLEDFPNHGFFIVYANQNQASNRKIRAIDTTTINPFSGTNDIGSGSEDDGLDSIRGANTGPVNFEMTLTRNAGALDITAQISGTDSVTGNPYLSKYTATGYMNPAIGFRFDRAGFFFGANVDAPSATLSNTVVTTNVPEPAGCLLIVLTACVLGSGRTGPGRSRTPR